MLLKVTSIIHLELPIMLYFIKSIVQINLVFVCCEVLNDISGLFEVLCWTKFDIQHVYELVSVANCLGE